MRYSIATRLTLTTASRTRNLHRLIATEAFVVAGTLRTCHTTCSWLTLPFDTTSSSSSEPMPLALVVEVAVHLEEVGHRIVAHALMRAVGGEADERVAKEDGHDGRARDLARQTRDPQP